MNDVEFEGFVENVSPEELEEKMKTLPALDVFEIGVGVGNAMFPLLRANPNLRFQCADVSETAIEQLEKFPAQLAALLPSYIKPGGPQGELAHMENQYQSYISSIEEKMGTVSLRISEAVLGQALWRPLRNGEARADLVLQAYKYSSVGD